MPGLSPPPPDRRWLAGLLLLVALFCAPMFTHPDGFLSGDSYRDNDWLTDRFFDLAASQTWLEHKTLPLRSHLVGGGYPTIGQPFDGSWAPTLLPVLAFGPVHGVKINLLLLLALGTLGTFSLARRWLELPTPAAAFAAAAFALSGWLPSMMLVGFWPQALYMVTPALLALMLSERPSGRILAGALLFLVLQQAGNALVAVVGFLGATAWVRATEQSSRTGRAWLQPLLWLLMATGSLAIARRYGTPSVLFVGAGLCALWAWRSVRLHQFGSALRRPAGRVAAVLLVASTLGVGKIVAMAPVVGSAEYAHVAHVPPSAWPMPGPNGGPARILRPGVPDEHFFQGPGELLRGLLGRAPRIGLYQTGPEARIGSIPQEQSDRSTAVAEYIHIGLTLPILLLALLGAVVGLRERGGRAQTAVLFGGVVALCLGPHLLPDVYFLLASGLPGFRGMIQPIKYYSFFILLPATLLSGLGALTASRFLSERLPQTFVTGLFVFCLLAPMAQNAPIWAARFAEPMPPWSCDGCVQVKQIAHSDWVGWPSERIDKLSDALFLRELRRPPAAREYDNAAHGVGTIDWYGTLRLPEPTVPSHYITPSGLVLPNPDYEAEAWLTGGRGRVRNVQIGPTRITADVDLDAPARLIINQAWLPGFVSTEGALLSDDGLLALDLSPGAQQVTIQYRPWPTLAGLAGSAVFFAFWSVTFLWLRRRGE